jgi:hypothetical protein
MANYILINYGKFPKYVTSSVKSILDYEEAPNIYLCSDNDIDHLELDKDRVTFVDLTKTQSKTTEEVIKLNYYPDGNPLWKTSLWRVFALKDIAKYLNLSSFIHFDNDVIIYESFKSYSNVLDKKKLYMTRLNKSRFVFGYMYCGDLDKLELLLHQIYLFISRKSFLFRVKYDKSFIHNEMEIIEKINKKYSLIEELPTIPINDFNYIFDPADYGFLIDGHPYETGVSNVYKKNIVGKYILKNKPIITFINNKPVLKANNQSYKIINLHIHSKNLESFALNPVPPIIE